MSQPQNKEESILRKLRALPPQKQEEVEDFVDFVSQRADDRLVVRAAAVLTEPSLNAVWDNPDDAEYDRI